MVRDFKGVAGGEAFYEELVRALGCGELLGSTREVEASGPTHEQVVAIRKARMSTFAFIDEIPVNKVPPFSHGQFSEARLEEMLRAAGEEQ